MAIMCMEKKDRKEKQLSLNQECLLKDLQDLQGRLVLWAPRVCKVPLVLLGTQVIGVHQDVLVFQVLMVYLDHRVPC